MRGVRLHFVCWSLVCCCLALSGLCRGSEAFAEEETEEEAVQPESILSQPYGFDAATQKLYDEAHSCMVKVYTNREDKRAIATALRAMEKVKSAAPKSPIPHYFVGELRYLAEEWESARSAFKRAVELAPTFVEAMSYLGAAYASDKKGEAALPHLMKAIELNPHYGAALYWTVHVLTNLGRFEEADKYLALAVKYHGKNETLDRFAEVIRLVTKGPGWATTYTHESENYIVRTDVSQDFAQQMSEQIELIRLVYNKVFPDVPKPDRKYIVLVFKEREDYIAAGMPRMSVGLYQPASRTLLLHVAHENAATISTLKHEGFHQYCHEYLDSIPTWFNEGLAEYFANSELLVANGKRGMKILPDEGRLQYLLDSFERKTELPSAATLMNMSHQEMYEPNRMGLHYALAWSYIYFSIEGQNGKYRPQIMGYFKALTKGKSQREAFDSTYRKIDMKKFEEEWKAMMRELGKARGRYLTE